MESVTVGGAVLVAMCGNAEREREAVFLRFRELHTIRSAVVKVKIGSGFSLRNPVTETKK